MVLELLAPRGAKCAQGEDTRAVSPRRETLNHLNPEEGVPGRVLQTAQRQMRQHSGEALGGGFSVTVREK